MNKVYVVIWREYERGWGNRPDGYSIHKTEEDMNIFIDTFLQWQDRLHKDLGGTGAPDEYSTNVDDYLGLVDDETFNKIEGHGLRVMNNNYPEKFRK